jgi:hypothetical protein
MKKLALLCSFGFALFALTSCEQENRISGCADPFAINFDEQVQVSDDDGSCVYPPEERRALIYDITATWCGPCGDWGFPAFEEATLETKTTAVAFGLHASSSDPMYNTVAEDLANNYPDFTGYPTLVVNNEADFSNAAGMVGAVDAFVEGEPEVTAINIMEINNGMAEIHAQARWFTAVNGTFRMAVYLVEDSLYYPQNGIDEDNVYHNHVLRAEAGGRSFGEVIVSGETWSGKTDDLKYTVPIDPAWNVKNLYAVTVIWREVGAEYDFINAYPGVEL